MTRIQHFEASWPKQLRNNEVYTKNILKASLMEDCRTLLKIVVVCIRDPTSRLRYIHWSVLQLLSRLSEERCLTVRSPSPLPYMNVVEIDVEVRIGQLWTTWPVREAHGGALQILCHKIHLKPRMLCNLGSRAQACRHRWSRESKPNRVCRRCRFVALFQILSIFQTIVKPS